MVETGNKNWPKARMFCEESLGKINKYYLELLGNGSVHEFYPLKEILTLEQVNTSVVKKREES